MLPPWRQLVDCGPEALLALHRNDCTRYPALLASSAAAGEKSRYDLLFCHATGVLTKRRDGTLDASGTAIGGARGFLDALEHWWHSERVQADSSASQSSDLPFRGGWFVFLGYEIAAEIEPMLDLPATPDSIVAAALRIPAAVIHDRRTRQTEIVAEPGHEAVARRIAADLARLGSRRPGSVSIERSGEEDPARHLRAIAHAKERIAAGDIYQANLSREWHARLRAPVHSADLFERLCASNPAGFAGVATLGELTIVSSSPERLITIRGGEVSTRPIAGTRPRAVDGGTDAVDGAALVAHPKERAEHVMLIDLERSDLGRVCEAGSVEVDELMVVESYAHVHHIVSNVRGRLRADVSPVEALRAVFPGGTITGVPKIRCMQIIAELEGRGRGAYTGTMGYLNLDGSCDFNILIRTIVREGDDLRFRAGGGIVADSVPERELEETRAKARGLLRALGLDTTP
ncbi:MAG TPA: aminodeoxychorismate synthase component I [Steroidobacteraceae bacterium]|nr:aminodeoxychorismate synthase component I [Steroidobacteraceae bacterium]